MESHIRIIISANWNALNVLKCSTYKVLIALAGRADHLGRCFPTTERIAEDTSLHVQTVYQCLDELEMCQYMGYLRKNEYDPVTSRKMPNVYIVSPYFLCIAEDYQLEALALWQSALDNRQIGGAYESFSYYNQQQEPAARNNTIESIPVTNNNNNNQGPEKSENAAPDYTNTPVRPDRKPQKSQDKNGGTHQQSEAPQRSENTGGSAKITERYNNPVPIAAPLLDGLQEALANDVNKLLIPIPMARGFVVGNGYDAVKAAYEQTMIADKDRVIRTTKAGFFRSILQRGYTDANLPNMRKEKNPFEGMVWDDFASNDKDYTSGEYSEFIES